MTLYSPWGGEIRPNNGIDLAAAAEAARRKTEDESKAANPVAGMDLEPGPGQLILLREEQPQFLLDDNDMAVPNPLYGRNNFARVARVGPDRPEVNQIAWFAKGDMVWVNTSLLEKVDFGGEPVEIGPFSCVKGKFVPKKA